MFERALNTPLRPILHKTVLTKKSAWQASLMYFVKKKNSRSILRTLNNFGSYMNFSLN